MSHYTERVDHLKIPSTEANVLREALARHGITGIVASLNGIVTQVTVCQYRGGSVPPVGSKMYDAMRANITYAYLMLMEE